MNCWNFLGTSCLLRKRNLFPNVCQLERNKFCEASLPIEKFSQTQFEALKGHFFFHSNKQCRVSFPKCKTFSVIMLSSCCNFWGRCGLWWDFVSSLPSVVRRTMQVPAQNLLLFFNFFLYTIFSIEKCRCLNQSADRWARDLIDLCWREVFNPARS